jgi:acyl-CoA synthetase (NDP forming)
MLEVRMSEELVRQLEPIFKATSVAIIGASKDQSKWGGRTLNRALESGFRGPIYAVNPRETEIAGLKVYKDVQDIPDPVDLAVFTIPAELMPKAMESCVKKGVRGGVIISADFAETGAHGRELQEETVRIAREGGIRFIGPNGNGMWTAAVNLNISPLPTPAHGGLAFISQSGMFGGAAGRAAQLGGYGLSMFVSMGNQADITVADYVEYLEQDDSTKVIALYVEGFKDGRRFAEIAKRVTQKKPIVILKGGRSSQGARATLSHTASIAGEDRVFDAMCKQTGLIRVYQLEHLWVAAQALLRLPIPRQGRVAIVGNGGENVVCVDTLISLGLEVPEFHEEDKLALKEMLPPHAPIPQNPVDFAAGAFGCEEEVAVLEKMASLDNIDAIITGPPRGQSIHVRGLAEQKKAVITALDQFCKIPEKYGKPLLVRSMGTDSLTKEMLRAAKIPIFGSTEECSLAMSALYQYGQIHRWD